MFKWCKRNKWVNVDGADANTNHLHVLNKLGLSGKGPDAGDTVEKKTVMYQQICTWVIEYDNLTKKAISAQVRMDEYPL
jgi:hypothetical protein